jgi:LysM repeat protein
MYLSYHNNFTAQPIHRSKNQTKSKAQSKFDQARSQINKSQRVKAGRIFILIMLLTLLFLSGAIVHAYAAQEPGAYGSTSTMNTQSEESSVVVYSGDTLWSIATEHASNRVDKRQYINKIMKLNHLSSTVLKEGQVLQLP